MTRFKGRKEMGISGWGCCSHQKCWKKYQSFTQVSQDATVWGRNTNHSKAQSYFMAGKRAKIADSTFLHNKGNA
jgi:hypothetical protein